MTVKTIIPQHPQDALAQAHARQARLRALDPDRMAEALTFLAGYSPAVFDATQLPRFFQRVRVCSASRRRGRVVVNSHR